MKDPDYQISKKQISLFDSGDLELEMDIDSDNSSFRWEGEGEVDLRMPKSKANPLRYWKSLLKSGDVKVSTWWEVKDEHVDAVEDLALDERKSEL